MRTKRKVNVVTDKNPYGAWVISAIINGYRVHRQYYGYTKQEAIQMFRHEMANE